MLTLGKNPFLLVRPGSAADEEAGAAEAGPAGQRERQPSHGFLAWAASLGDLVTPAFSRRRQQPVQARDLESRVVQRGEPLDLDVIDTSWMDSNVQSLRHNYFNVNRWMLDDIRETLIHKRRAHTRTGRMTHRRGNVWSFIGAPKYIVNQS